MTYSKEKELKGEFPLSFSWTSLDCIIAYIQLGTIFVIEFLGVSSCNCNQAKIFYGFKCRQQLDSQCPFQPLTLLEHLQGHSVTLS